MKRALPVIDVQNEYCTGKLSITYPDYSMTNIVISSRSQRLRASW